MYNQYFKISNDKNEKGFKILSSWGTDYGDCAYNCLLYEERQIIGNVVICIDDGLINHAVEEAEIGTVLEEVRDNFDLYKNLPKLSKGSQLLQDIYETVCSSDSNMCHIDDDDWLDWQEDYEKPEIEFSRLVSEIHTYHLEDVITINEDGYKICGYGDLITRFNDDRNLVEEYNLSL